MPFQIIRQDITKIKTDAIVNAANTELKMGGGVCGVIFQAAGKKKLEKACGELAPIQTGEAVITPGFDLPAKFIIHTAGPVYSVKNKEESERLLRSSYMNSMKKALEYQCSSIAFPLISSGIYGYPKEEAFKTAVSAIEEILRENELEVFLVIYDKQSFSIGKDLLGEIESYIDEHYLKACESKERKLLALEERILRRGEEEKVPYMAEAFEAKPMNLPASSLPLDHLVDNLEEPFSRMLLDLIDSKGKTDVEVYKRANLDRKLFSKIRSNEAYMPSKRTVIALAVGLELSLGETESLLERAGYALSHAVKSDVIIEYFIKKGKYNIFEINEVLFQYDQPLLGS
ncbi:MAG: macro domain-containing protein [Johnsonella sp.]|nr:macro domain-containing protein [Johnsonella sp.]